MYRRKLLKHNIQSLVEFSQVSRGSIDDVNGLGICVTADLSELYVTGILKTMPVIIVACIWTTRMNDSIVFTGNKTEL
jgi:hypothetical protein